MIRLRGVSKTFRRGGRGAPVRRSRDVDLDIARDSFVSLVGPSGCGKTTLLRLIDGLLAPGRGQRSASTARRRGRGRGSRLRLPVVPADARGRRSRDNVGFGLAARRQRPAAERRERVRAHLDLVGLARFADAYPHELSGGMKQRAALARALATEPEILLMDEPFASIDAQTRELMQVELLRIWGARRGVVVFVTHSVDEAVAPRRPRRC